MGNYKRENDFSLFISTFPMVKMFIKRDRNREITGEIHDG